MPATPTWDETTEVAPSAPSWDETLPVASAEKPGFLERIRQAAATPSPPWLQPFETAVRANVQPFIEHPFVSAYKTVVPQREDIEAFAPSNLARTTPVGSQE